MDRLMSISVFVRVVEKGSFAAVVDEFSISPTMVAKHIRALEKHLDARLLERTTRKHKLTEIGNLYYERCKDLLAELQSADQVVDQFRSKPRGTLRVTAPITYGVHKLVPVLAEYMAMYPQVNIELSLSDRVVDLVEEGIEVAIRSGTIDSANLVARPIRSHKMVLVASDAYLKKYGTPQHPTELENHNCLGFMPWGNQPTWRFTKNSQTLNILPKGNFTTNNGQALKNAALNGIGIILQSEVLLEDDITNGKLKIVLPDWSLPTRPVHVVRTQDMKPTQKIRSFVDFVVEKLG